MLSDVWEWAGLFRSTVKNIGVNPEQISSELKKACDDLKFWEKNATYPLHEMAVRFHHRLVSIHPFPNGNGRFSRLAADILLNGATPFSWGGNLAVEGQNRKKYLKGKGTWYKLAEHRARNGGSPD